MTDFLAFVECAGCGEMFPVRKKMAMNRAKWCSERCRKAQYHDFDPCVDCGSPTSSGPRNGRRSEPRCDGCREHRLHAAKRADDERAISLRAEGLTNQEIASILASTAQSVASRLYRSKLDGNTVARSPYWERGTQDWEFIVEAFREGRSVREIAQQLGVTPNAIYERIYYQGLTIRALREQVAA